MLRYLLIVFVMMLSGCGGGGGGTTVDSPATKTAVLKLSTSGTPSAQLAGISISIALPNGVTPQMNGVAVDNSIAVVSGAASGGTVLQPTYSENNGILNISFASNLNSGFGSGEFISIKLKVANNTSPQINEFILSNFKPVDINGNIANGLSPSVTGWVINN